MMRQLHRFFPLFLMLCLGATAVRAHEGHDHDDAPAPVNAHAPARLSDGSVFLPKAAQHLLAVRTQVVQEQDVSRSVELSAQVVMDPNAGALVQPGIAGRLQPGPRGLPSVGQSVRQGQVLAYVLASSTPMERAAQAAQLAELRAAHTLAQQRLARLQSLGDTVARKDMEALQAEQVSLAARISALADGLHAREALLAPVSGVIASSNAVAGQVVDARELLYEIVDPTRLHIEALSFEPQLAADITAASAVLGDVSVPLQFIGSARSLRAQALPLRFQARQPQALAVWALGQPLTVVVQTRSTLRAVAVPTSALVRNSANQTVVWVKTAPERFVPQVVTVQPLDGTRVAITGGLPSANGQALRVLTQAAALVNQIR